VRRTIFTDEHEQFRQLVRTFLEKECVPHTAEWLEAGVVSREAWRKAGELGLLGWMVPEEYGGLGIRDFRYSVVIAEEIAATGTQGIALALHNDVVAPYLTDLTNQEQKKRWLPGFVTGERLVAIAMSEPGAGSDLKQVKATARRDGDHYILNGTKTHPVRPRPARLRPAHRRVPGEPVRAGGDEDQAGCRARLPRPVCAGGRGRRAHRG